MSYITGSSHHLLSYIYLYIRICHLSSSSFTTQHQVLNHKRIGKPSATQLPSQIRREKHRKMSAATGTDLSRPLALGWHPLSIFHLIYHILTQTRSRSRSRIYLLYARTPRACRLPTTACVRRSHIATLCEDLSGAGTANCCSGFHRHGSLKMGPCPACWYAILLCHIK